MTPFPDTAEMWNRRIGERFTATTSHDNYATFGLAVVLNAVEDLQRYCNRFNLPQWDRVRCKRKSGETDQDHSDRCKLATMRYRRTVTMDAINADLWLQGRFKSRMTCGWLLRTLGYDRDEFLDRVYKQFPRERIEELRNCSLYGQRVEWCQWWVRRGSEDEKPTKCE